MIILALCFLSLFSENKHIVVILHIQWWAFWKKCFSKIMEISLLQKKFIKKFLRIPLHFSLSFAVICHLSLGGAVLLLWSLRCRMPHWKELCQGCLLCGGQRVSEILSSPECSAVWGRARLAKASALSAVIISLKFCFLVTVFLMLGLCSWPSNTPAAGSSLGSSSSCCLADPQRIAAFLYP